MAAGREGEPSPFRRAWAMFRMRAMEQVLGTQGRAMLGTARAAMMVAAADPALPRWVIERRRELAERAAAAARSLGRRRARRWRRAREERERAAHPSSTRAQSA